MTTDKLVRRLLEDVAAAVKCKTTRQGGHMAAETLRWGNGPGPARYPIWQHPMQAASPAAVSFPAISFRLDPELLDGWPPLAKGMVAWFERVI